MSNPKKAYYVVNQVLFHFEAPDGKPVFPLDESNTDTPVPEEILTQFEKGFEVKFQTTKQRAIPLSGKKARGFVRLEMMATRRISVARYVTEMTDRIVNPHGHFEFSTKDGRKLWLIGVAPNWLCGTTQGTSIGIGGPGTQPVFSHRSITTQPSITWPSFRSPTFRGGEVAVRTVHVFVLDTVPEDVGKSGGPQRPNFDSAHKPSSDALVIEDPPGYPVKIGDPTADDKHMPEHGTFIAGIIGTIAPSAKIHLVQVLNNHGIGSVESIAAGFALVRDAQAREFAGAPCLINCSFAVAVPVIQDPAPTGPNARLQAHDVTDLDVNNKDPNQISSSHDLFHDIADLALPNPYKCGIVAAAGNDSESARPPETLPFMARYPARLDTVLGVGALDKSGMRANFSNAPDNPAAIGLMTLGSLVGPMFDIDNNAMDFAEWGGTSFATPVITGLIAKLMGEYGFDFPGAVAELRNAEPVPFDAIRNLEPMTGGEIVKVTQP